MNKQVKFRLEDGAIVDQHGGLLYESIGLEHLNYLAKRRLTEIHTKQPGIDYEAAEVILIDEGLYQLESEDDNEES